MSDTQPSPGAELPKTYDHVEAERRWQRAWDEWGIYRFDPNSAAAQAGRLFSVDTPPPYVSAAHLHVGHAMSYSQAEFVVRFQRMRGAEVFYPMGFDDNGLPTERYVEKTHGKHKGNCTRKEFIDLCLEETRKGAQVYEDLWRSLGLSVDWRMTYSTIAPRAVTHAQRSFLELARAGRVERRAEPILWDPRMQTALAQTDIEPGPEESRPLHRLRFDRAGGGEPGVIDTTRPELVPACVALACHPDDARFADVGAAEFLVPLTDLRADGSRADHRRVPLVRDGSVDPTFGTGLMMVCTFGDQEDVVKWRLHSLPMNLIVAPDGAMNTPDLPELHGKRVHVIAKGDKLPEARLAARELLAREGHLLGVSDNVSRAAVSERSGTPIEIQVVPQWFVRLLDRRDELLARGRELQWYPAFMRDRYEAWVEGLKWDWNISRQRFYGVAFPVWYREDTGEAVLPEAADLPLDPLTDAPPPSVLRQVPEGVALRPEEDVMDTWMTSSLTPLINANWAYWDRPSPHAGADVAARPTLLPMTVRVQAFEIIRTWLFYSVAKAHDHLDALPWRDVMISGWGLDKQGKKMSKRLGNFVDPATVIQAYSADALRYWAAGATLGNDLRYLEEDVKGGKRLLTKLWNSTRFALGCLDGWRPDADRAEAPTAADLWIRARLDDTVRAATEGFSGYEYNRALRATETLFWRDWCDQYLEIVKDRFRGDAWDPAAVEAGRRTVLQGTWTLLRLFAPVLPFLTEELYQRGLRPWLEPGAPRSVHVAAWPQSLDGRIDGREATPGADAALADGALLVDLIAAVRQQKTLQRAGLGTPVAVLELTAAGPLAAAGGGAPAAEAASTAVTDAPSGASSAAVARVDADLRAAARAAAVRWVDGAADGAWTQVGERALWLRATLAPRTEAV